MNKKQKNGNLTLIRLPKTKTSCPVLHLLLLLLLLLLFTAIITGQHALAGTPS